MTRNPCRGGRLGGAPEGSRRQPRKLGQQQRPESQPLFQRGEAEKLVRGMRVLVSAGQGATVAQIADATAWNSNTVRGFLAGLKKKG